MPDLPIVCTLDPATRTDGFRLWFTPSGDVLALAARVIDAERRCCRFLRFTLTVEPDDGAMVLDLTGPPGTRGFLAALFEPPEPPSDKPA